MCLLDRVNIALTQHDCCRHTRSTQRSQMTDSLHTDSLHLYNVDPMYTQLHHSSNILQMFKMFISKQHICSLRNVYKDGFLAVPWNDKAMTFLTTEWLDHTVACRPSTCSLGPTCNTSISHIWRRIATSLCWRYDAVKWHSIHNMKQTADSLLFSKHCATVLITSSLIVTDFPTSLQLGLCNVWPFWHFYIFGKMKVKAIWKCKGLSNFCKIKGCLLYTSDAADE